MRYIYIGSVEASVGDMVETRKGSFIMLAKDVWHVDVLWLETNERRKMPVSDLLCAPVRVVKGS